MNDCNNKNNTTAVYKMLYKMSLSVSEIPPLFVQLDQLSQNINEHPNWEEKARYVTI